MSVERGWHFVSDPTYLDTGFVDSAGSNGRRESRRTARISDNVPTGAPMASRLSELRRHSLPSYGNCPIRSRYRALTRSRTSRSSAERLCMP